MLKKSLIVTTLIAGLGSLCVYAQDVSTDVVIAGGGMSGMMAAVELTKAAPDLNVILVEKQNSLGGNLMYTGGVIMGFDDTYTGSENQEVASPERFQSFFHNVRDQKAAFCKLCAAIYDRFVCDTELFCDFDRSEIT